MDGLDRGVRIRIRLVSFVFILGFGLIVARAFNLQVVNQEAWQKRAEHQHQKVIPLAPQRGTIFDRNGDEMAVSILENSIYVEPRKVTAPRLEAQALSAALSLPVPKLEAKLTSTRGFLWLKRKAPPAESGRVRALDLPGINFIKEYKRFYPNSGIGAQVIGFTGIDPKGLEGIELKYDSLIQGQAGYLETERDALGRGIGAGDKTVEGDTRGCDLYLTLDKNLQYIAEKELVAGVRSARAKAGTVVVMDPRTGAVLAMANQPSYNPNAFTRYRPGQWRNRAVCDIYEPGSTIKAFLLAAALDAGVIHRGETFYCEHGAYEVGGKIIHDDHSYGRLKVGQILKYSSNIGAAKIGAKLGRERYYHYLRAFGFGEPTGIDLPGEVGGLLRKPAGWFDVDLATISFGQGISVTPLQLATAAAAIANGGKLMAPFVVKRIVNPYGEVVENRPPEVVRQVVSAKVAREVRNIMITATQKGGTGTLAQVPGFLVAGKTGTAQEVDPVTGGYSADRRVGSFVGLVPAEDPRLVILVVIDEPEDKIYGGLVAAPIFAKIASQSLQYLKITPTQPQPQNPLPAPVRAESRAATAPERLLPHHLAAARLRMPDCVGMSYRQVLQVMAKTGLNIKLKGSGRVLQQSPAPGAPVRYGSEIWVRLAPPG